MKRFGLTLETNLLDFFLKRLNVDLTLTSGSIPYRDVVNAFKQRSDPTKKRINADNPLYVSFLLIFFFFQSLFVSDHPNKIVKHH